MEWSPVCRAGGVEVKVLEAPALLWRTREMSGFHGEVASGRERVMLLYMVGATGCPPWGRHSAAVEVVGEMLGRNGG